MNKSRIVRVVLFFIIVNQLLLFHQTEKVVYADQTRKKTPATQQWTAGQLEFFEKKVRPVFVEHCQSCHGEKKQEGEFRIDSRDAILRGGETGTAMKPGFPKQSELILAINYDDDSYQMPPDGKLSQEKIAAITAWVKQGAAWTPGDLVKNNHQVKQFVLDTDHWSLQPITKPSLPTVSQPEWTTSPVDRFILAKLEKEKLLPSEKASRAILARRVYFDLVGLPASVEQLNAFLEDDSEDAFAKLVERLLASPQYGERWARHWLDLVRFAETFGHEFDYDIGHTSHYRDYVIRAINKDIPFDQFALEHFAGDLLSSPRYRVGSESKIPENESVLATGFFWMGSGKQSPVDVRAEQCDLIDNQIDVLSKAFLGTSVACARCHDHKFDPISIKDYYAISGIMESSRRHYADIRKQEPLDEVIKKIHQLKQDHRVRLIEYSADQMQKWLTAISEDKITINWAQPELNQLKHPLYFWNRLQALNDQQEFCAEKQKIIQQFERHKKQATLRVQDSTSFAVFDRGLPKGWTQHGQSFLQPTTKEDRLMISSDPWKPVHSLQGTNTLHSGSASGRSYGVIRSPTFIIKKPFIDYHVCRSEGNRLVPSRFGSQLKKGQVHLIVDGFQHIRNPIYGKLSFPVKIAGQPTWHRQNVKRWIGHRAYIEILDEQEGALQIDSIHFSSGKPLAENLNSLLLNKIDSDKPTSLNEVKKTYLSLWQQVLNQYRDSAKKEVTINDNSRQLINWMLKQSKQIPMEIEHPEWLDQFYLKMKDLEAQLGQPKLALSTTEGNGINSRYLIRGNSKKPAEEVPRRFLEIFDGTNKNISASSSGRLEMARQIISEQNPLFDRVIVNRVWAHHFGRGIVATPDDFGRMGIPPSHPELLDYLVSEFRKNGRSLKWLHRFLLNTSTYQMKSDLRNEAIEIDPENRLWHRMPIRRLEGEAIRDSALAISGALQLTLYGPSIPPHLTPFMQGRGRPSASGPLDGNGRRSIYINVRRNFLTPMFLAFDYPLPMTTTGKRSVSNVPAQALTMMNNQFGTQQASRWARTLLEKKNCSRTAQIQHAYLQAYSRKPTKKETEKILQFISEELKAGRDEVAIWSDVCHVLFNVKEFVFVQ